IALVFSPDERLLYITVEVVPYAYGWPEKCEPEGRAAGAKRPQGALYIVDVGKAETQPEKSVIGIVGAGCSPVRAAISPGGDMLYVTARNSNAMLAFDTAKLRADPQHALVGAVPVGAAPVPLIVADKGKK